MTTPSPQPNDELDKAIEQIVITRSHGYCVVQGYQYPEWAINQLLLAAKRSKELEKERDELRVSRLKTGQIIATLRTALGKAHKAMLNWFSSEYAAHPLSKEVEDALNGVSSNDLEQQIKTVTGRKNLLAADTCHLMAELSTLSTEYERLKLQCLSEATGNHAAQEELKSIRTEYKKVLETLKGQECHCLNGESKNTQFGCPRCQALSHPLAIETMKGEA